MRNLFMIIAISLLLFTNGCVSSKEFISFQENYSLIIKNLEQDIGVLNNELNSMRNTLEMIEKSNYQRNELIDASIQEIKIKMKNTNDLLSTLRIEVALLNKKQRE